MRRSVDMSLIAGIYDKITTPVKWRNDMVSFYRWLAAGRQLPEGEIKGVLKKIRRRQVIWMVSRWGFLDDDRFVFGVAGISVGAGFMLGVEFSIINYLILGIPPVIVIYVILLSIQLTFDWDYEKTNIETKNWGWEILAELVYHPDEAIRERAVEAVEELVERSPEIKHLLTRNFIGLTASGGELRKTVEAVGGDRQVRDYRLEYQRG